MSDDQIEGEVDSQARRVTFFEDRARVERRARTTLSAGTHTLRIEGPSLLIHDPSLSVRLSGDHDTGRVIHARVRRMLRGDDGDPEELEKLEEEFRRARSEYNAMQRAANRAELERQRLSEMESSLLEDAFCLGVSEPSSEQLREAFAAFRERQRANAEESRERQQDLQAAERSVERARDRLEEARRANPEFAAFVEVDYEAESPGEAELELTYLVPCALWRPSHVATLEGDGESRRLEIESFATVWQTTGESWDDVECRFSTARPSQKSSPPEITEDRLRVYQKSEEQRNRVTIEQRELDIDALGPEGPRSVDQMPGVDDGGRSVEFTSGGSVRIPSNGEPFRISVGTHSLDADVETVAYPERTVVPHVRVSSTWEASWPLLAGPVSVLRNEELAGRSETSYVAPGERFELGMGPESGMRVRRRTTSDEETSSLSGKRTVTRRTTVYVSNLSEETKDLRIVERVPVSEIDEVEVNVDDNAGGRLDEDGFLSLDVVLGSNEVTDRTIEYRVVYDKNVEHAP